MVKEEKIVVKQKNTKKTRRTIIGIILTVAVIAILISAIQISRFFLSEQEFSKSEKNIAIPIFVYHDIVEVESEKNLGPEYMQTTKEKFLAQMKGLMRLGYKAISYDDLVSYNKGEKKLPEKVFLLSFDDGWEGNYTVLFPIIKELKIPISINIVDDTVGTQGALTWDQIKEMEASGLVSIYSHGKRHVESYTQTTEQIVEEVNYAHNQIEKQLGKPEDKVFTYPYGIYEEEKVEALAKEGYIQNLTDNKVNQSETLNLSKLHREYPLNDSFPKILLKTWYRMVRYGN